MYLSGESGPQREASGRLAGQSNGFSILCARALRQMLGLQLLCLPLILCQLLLWARCVHSSVTQALAFAGHPHPQGQRQLGLQSVLGSSSSGLALGLPHSVSIPSS